MIHQGNLETRNITITLENQYDKNAANSHMVKKIHHAGDQAMYWDVHNKGKSSLTGQRQMSLNAAGFLASWIL